MGRKRTFPGSIYVRNGYLYIRVGGKRFSTGLRDTQKGRQYAEALLRKIWLEGVGLQEISRKPSLYRAFAEFLSSKLNIMEKTRKSYIYAFKRIFLVDSRLTESEVENQVKTYVQSTTDRPTSIHINLRSIRVFLRWCVEKGWLSGYKFLRNYFPKNRTKTSKNFSDAEIDKILGYFQENNREMYNLIRFMILTGARLVDVLTLEWGQIRENKIHWENKITKTIEPRMFVREVVSILEEQRKISPKKVFSWKYSSASSLRRMLKKALEELGIYNPGRGFQGFRVYFRMRLLSGNFPIEYVVYLMRHSSAAITLEHYTEFLEKKIIEEAEKILENDTNSTHKNVSS